MQNLISRRLEEKRLCKCGRRRCSLSTTACFLWWFGATLKLGGNPFKFTLLRPSESHKSTHKAQKKARASTHARTFKSLWHCPSAERWYLTDGTEKRSETRDIWPVITATKVILFFCVLLILAQLLATQYRFGIKSRVLWYIVEGKQTFTFTFFHSVWGFSARFLTFADTPEKKRVFVLPAFDGNAANSPSLWMFRSRARSVVTALFHCSNRNADKK